MSADPYILISFGVYLLAYLAHTASPNTVHLRKENYISQLKVAGLLVLVAIGLWCTFLVWYAMSTGLLFEELRALWVLGVLWLYPFMYALGVFAGVGLRIPHGMKWSTHGIKMYHQSGFPVLFITIASGLLLLIPQEVFMSKFIYSTLLLVNSQATSLYLGVVVGFGIYPLLFTTRQHSNHAAS